jgi:mono/diheme cytochrome c family protein
MSALLAFRVRLALAIAASAVVSGAPAVQSPRSASPAYFEATIRPILAAKCYNCHSQKPMGKLRLDNPEDMMEGGSRGPAIIPGDPDRSLLIVAVRQTDPALKMPMAAPKLEPSEINALVAWVKAGAALPKRATALARH